MFTLRPAVTQFACALTMVLAASFTVATSRAAALEVLPVAPAHINSGSARTSLAPALVATPIAKNSVSAEATMMSASFVPATLPEPASWTLLLTGLVIVGFARRRRQIAVAA
jgi:hypothetical protein